MTKVPVALSTSIIASLAIISASPSRSQTTTASPRPRAAPPTVSYIEDATVTALQEMARGSDVSKYNFLGLSVDADDSQRLYVTSYRSLIAFKTASAVESGARYRPPRDQRQDVVLVDCGDEDLGERFECTRVVVKVNGKTIKPHSYQAGSNSYRNAFGAVWSVREVSATYPAKLLRGGFSVDYSSPDGSEWTFDVSADDAESKLLLTFTPTTMSEERAYQGELAAAAQRQEAEQKAEELRLSSERVDQEVLKLSSPSVIDRLVAAQWFVDSPVPPPSRAARALVEALKDSESGVQRAAANALRRMGAAASSECEGLTAARQTAPPSVVRHIAEAHAAVCGGDPQ